MSPNRSTPNSPPSSSAPRHHIPNKLINNWQSLRAGRPAAAGRVRRPPTACLNCRGAKVKCSGQRECARCVSRSLHCVYPRQTAVSSPPQQPSDRNAASGHPDAGVGAWPSMLPTAADASLNAEASLPPHVSSSHILMPAAGSLPPTVDIAKIPDCDDLNGFGWAPANPVLVNPAFESLGPAGLCDREILASLGHVHQDNGMANDSLASIFHNESPLSIPDALPALTSGDYSEERSGGSPPECRCRVNIMLFPPRVNRAMRGKRLDTIFNVTREMMTGCQDLINCVTCDVGCADLLLMMTILQETSGCFEYIAKSNLDSAVKVSFGDYEITSESPQFRSVLVTDLVQRASAVLSSVSAKCRSKIEEVESAHCDLARANNTYLETTIDHFKSVLRSVTDYVATCTTGSGSAMA